MRRQLVVLAVLALALAPSLPLAACLGAVPVPWSVALRSVWAAATGVPDPSLPPDQQMIVAQIRLPRILAAVLVGAALAAAGAVLQALLRNPLADPYILGISGGAGFGAACAMALGWTAAAGVLPAAAFAGALAAVALVVLVARRVAGTDGLTLLLAGVMVNTLFGALILFLYSLAQARDLQGILLWMMGHLAVPRLPVGLLAAVVLPGILLLAALGRGLDLLATGDETAATLGLPVARLRAGAVLATTLLVGLAVAAAGLVGFVGLVVPHAVRRVAGPSHRGLVAASALAGGLLLLWADTLARTVAAPAELPVGVVTALVGAPAFLAMLAARGRS